MPSQAVPLEREHHRYVVEATVKISAVINARGPQEAAQYLADNLNNTPVTNRDVQGYLTFLPGDVETSRYDGNRWRNKTVKNVKRREKEVVL